MIRTFRKSSVKKEVLEQYVILEHTKELSLVLESKIRFSFMFGMIERLLLPKKCFTKALLDLSIEHDISPTEFLFSYELKCAH